MKRTPKTAFLQKLQPKLQMIRNGNLEVSMLRSGQCAALRYDGRIPDVVPDSVEQIAIATAQEHRKSPTMKDRGTLKQPTRTASVSVFIEAVGNESGESAFQGERSRLGNLATATVPMSKLQKLAERPDVSFVGLGEPLVKPRPIISTAISKPPSKSERLVESTLRHHDGRDVIIGIIDVGGFDFSHHDFLDSKGKTRFRLIWDQGGAGGPAPSDGRFNYGREINKDQMDRAITSSRSIAVPAFELEPQSQMDESSHGTHVASIAAGNRGVCRKAEIVGVLIALGEEDEDRRRSFYDSTRIVDAIEYLLAYADKRKKPISINISLGTNGSAHDGSSPLSRWIDSSMSKRGRSVCIAAGNAGQELPEHDQDIGHWMGRIHTRGTIPAAGLTSDIRWRVVGNGDTDVSENELEIWYAPQDRFAVTLRSPDGQVIGPVEPGEYFENLLLDNSTVISIYNEVYHPSNGANYISIYLTPFYSIEKVVGVKSGEWVVRLHGRDVRNGRYDGWIERDDPRPLGRAGEKEYWNFPSFFGELSNTDDTSISSLACGHRVVSVANLDLLRERISASSSQGPTRDGRFKPDIAAPGTDIVAANGFAGPDRPWVTMSGTSMASPYVAGVIGLMFAIQPNLTAAQIEGILHSTSFPLPGGDYKWSNAAGFGRINPTACLSEAGTINNRVNKNE